MTREISTQDARLPNGFLRDSEIFINKKKRSSKVNEKA